MLLPFHDAVFQLIPRFHDAVQFSQADAGREKPLQAAVYVFLGQQALLYGFGNVPVRTAAVQIRSRMDSGGNGVDHVFAEPVAARLVEIMDGPAVR